MQGEHGTLTGTTDEHQYQGCRNDKATGSKGLGHVCLDERLCTIGHHNVGSHEREAERLHIVAEDKDTDEEEHIGKARHDECLLRGSNGGLQRIVEANEQVRRNPHQLPEHVHLEDVGSQYQTQH